MKEECYKCGVSGVPLMVQMRFKSYTRYICRKCNTKRFRKYRKTKKGKENVYRAVYKSIRKLAYKQRARGILNYHVSHGSIVRPTRCKCGNKKVEAHHDDYSKPLEVKWLCRSCHADLHRKNDRLQNQS